MSYSDEDQELLEKLLYESSSSYSNVTREVYLRLSAMEIATFCILVMFVLIVIIFCVDWLFFDSRFRHCFRLPVRTRQVTSSAIDLTALTFSGPKLPSGEPAPPSEQEPIHPPEDEQLRENTQDTPGGAVAAAGRGGPGAKGRGGARKGKQTDDVRKRERALEDAKMLGNTFH